MIKNKITIALAMTGLFFASCEKENEIDEIMVTPQKEKIFQTSNNFEDLQTLSLQQNALEELPKVGHNFKSHFSTAVDATPCGPTGFANVQNYYLGLLGQDLIPIFGVDNANYLLGLYMDLNFYGAYLDQGEQYFGENGKYTQLIIKRQRELEKFWSMPNEIRINGQHTATLNDRERLADIWEAVGVGVSTREEAYALADTYLYYNSLASQLPESPFFALDGFATSGNLIVIGDGIVQMLAETGIDEDIVWTGILSHEWAHQVQFNNYANWYPEGAADNAPEATRYTELEADFLSAYYMTHKRGATYNWKRVEQFFQLFAQIGDCGFENPGHHGTPAQRFNAAQLGYELANGAHKQGHIMTEQELHEYFVANVDSLL